MSSEGKPQKADKALTQKRIDDILRIRLDGAQFWDVREFVREKEKEPGSNWFIEDGVRPLSEGTIRNYQTKADTLMMKAHERKRGKLFRRHLAQRRHLYAKAATTGDVRTALACLQDEAKLIGLYPAEKTTNDVSGVIQITTIEAVPPDDHIAAADASETSH